MDNSRISDKYLPVLAAAVLLQAVKDYKWLLRGRHIGRQTTESMERFFRSSWCDSLMDVAGFHVDPERIIEETRKNKHTDIKGITF